MQEPLRAKGGAAWRGCGEKEKKKAMEKFTSQKKERNYLKAIKSLNEYRSEIYGLKNPAEAFFAIPADLLVKLYTEK